MSWFPYQKVIQTPVEDTSEAHAQRAHELAVAADDAFKEQAGGLMGPSPVVMLADMHAHVALALKAVGR